MSKHLDNVLREAVDQGLHASLRLLIPAGVSPRNIAGAIQPSSHQQTC